MSQNARRLSQPDFLAQFRRHTESCCFLYSIPCVCFVPWTYDMKYIAIQYRTVTLVLALSRLLACKKSVTLVHGLPDVWEVAGPRASISGLGRPLWPCYTSSNINLYNCTDWSNKYVYIITSVFWLMKNLMIITRCLV